MLLKTLLTCSLFVTLQTAVAEISFQSSEAQVGLLELYTSEGCSSCPPADRWVSSLKDHKGLWREIIPIAFHVDYWDYLGWKDRFASPDYSQRHRDYAASQGIRTVYTPGFVFNGREWRNWFVRRLGDFPSGKTPGSLSVLINNGQANVKYESNKTLKNPQVYIALLGFDLSTPVRAGENADRTLKHDFVVLGLNKMRLKLKEDHYEVSMELPGINYKAPRLGIAIWIAEGTNPAPVQAVGGWLPDNV